MDQIDTNILKMLKKDSRKKYVEIAKAVNLTEGAVRRRVKKLQQQGIIQKFTIDTKVEMEAIILVKTNPSRTRDLSIKIRDISEKVYEVSGDYDIAALIQAYTIEELNKKIDEIRDLPAILNTNTLIKLL